MKALAYAPDGHPSVSYQKNGQKGVYFAHYDGAAWSYETVDATDEGNGQDLEYDPDSGQATISYGWGTLKFARRIGPGNWSVESVEAKSYNDMTSLAYDADGNPTIVYTATIGGKSYLRYARWNGSAWEKQTVGNANEGRWKEHAFDLTGKPGIAYSRDASGDGQLDTLMYAHWNGTSWDYQVVETGTAGFGVSPSLAYDPVTGYPAVTHRGPAGAKLRYLRYDGIAWNLEVVDPDLDQGQLQVAPDGAHTIGAILFLDDPQGNELWIARRIGGVWQKEFISTGVSGSQLKVGMKINPDGRPAMALWAADGIRFAEELP